MIHNKKCLLRQAEAKAFEEAHPNCCRRCSGWGVVGRGDEQDTCPECLDKGKCPSCGERVELKSCDFFDYYYCTSCPFDEKALREGEIPDVVYPHHDCLCWIDDGGQAFREAARTRYSKENPPPVRKKRRLLEID